MSIPDPSEYRALGYLIDSTPFFVHVVFPIQDERISF